MAAQRPLTTPLIYHCDRRAAVTDVMCHNSERSPPVDSLIIWKLLSDMTFSVSGEQCYIA